MFRFVGDLMADIVDMICIWMTCLLSQLFIQACSCIIKNHASGYVWIHSYLHPSNIIDRYNTSLFYTRVSHYIPLTSVNVMLLIFDNK